MGTSNWQNIPYNIDALMKIEPKRVLDIGVGFGRWGVLVREFCDVWFQRVQSDTWKVRIEGVEAFAPNIEQFQRAFYDEIHIGDAAEVVDTLDGRFDVVLFGDVLEHFTKDTATVLLNKCLDRSDYVMVNIPIGDDWPQEEMYGNPYEAHLSEWDRADFKQFDLVRDEMFQDFAGRPFGVFILSRKDPKDLRGSLFSKGTALGESAAPAGGVSGADEQARMRRIQDRVEDLAFELDFLKTCRPIRRLLRRPARVLRSLGRWRKNGIAVRALGEADAKSSGVQVALLGARSEVVQRGLPWYFMDGEEAWILRDHPQGHYGSAMVADEAGTLRMILRGHVPRLFFRAGPNAGKVEVTRRGHAHVLDLYAETPAVVEFDPKDGCPVGDDDVARHAVVTPLEIPAADEALRKMTSSGSNTLAVCVDGWLGIQSATETLFEHSLQLPQNFKGPAFDQWTTKLLDAGVRHLVLSGVTPDHLRLGKALHDKDSSVRVDAVWHGSYVQARESFAWSVWTELTEAAKAGWLHKIGFVKAGMEQWAERLGYRAGLLLNSVPTIPEAASKPDSGGPHLGLWMSSEGYRKPPYAMLAAANFLDGATIHGAGLSRRALEFMEFSGLSTLSVSDQTVPRTRMLELMRKTHATLYVTLSECCPMLPLESFSAGVPCLVGPNSHLFEDHDGLRELLVVRWPERAEKIAESLATLLERRDEAVAMYREWAPGYLERARASVQQFLAD